ncbi:HI_0552 family protein [Streptococcus pneumoniae]
MFQALEAFLAHQGEKYTRPQKAGAMAAYMEELKAKGQAARKEFQELSKAFQASQPQLTILSTSQWMNQAQILRPHFWTYFQAEGEESEPMFALRLYGKTEDFGVSLEVSFLERKKDEDSLSKQNRVLASPLSPPSYYVVQEANESNMWEATQENRLSLIDLVQKGEVRKVLLRQDIALKDREDMKMVLQDLSDAYHCLEPFYQLTRQKS